MITCNNMIFATNIRVLFVLKQKYSHKTLTETYKIFENNDIDTVLEVLNASYNEANNTNLSLDDFATELALKEVGFVKITEIYSQVVNGIMFTGLSPEEIEERKNAIKNLK